MSRVLAILNVSLLSSKQLENAPVQYRSKVFLAFLRWRRIRFANLCIFFFRIESTVEVLFLYLTRNRGNIFERLRRDILEEVNQSHLTAS